MDRFYQLPPELRATVVECLVDHWRHGDESDSIAGYASVCKEWQAIVERYNFSVLRVTQSGLDEFETSLVGSRRGLLRQINLYVQLPTYDNDPCEKKETWEDKAENNTCFTRAVYGLFRLMSSWTLEEAHRDGIDLTLSISSPSDLRNANFELWQRRRWNIKDIGEKRFADSWIDFVGHDEEFARMNLLPFVQVIRSFKASPQNHRALMPAAHADIIARLPGLQEAAFDVLKDRRKETRKIHFNQFAGSMTTWPLSLQSLSISSNTISSWRQIPHEALAEADSGQRLCEKLRNTARHLKHLNITNVVRIREFLRPYWPQGMDDTEPFLMTRLYKPDFWRLETMHVSYGSIWYNTEWHKQGDDINESSDLIDFRQSVSLAAARLAYTMPALKHMTVKQRPLMYAGKHELEYKVEDGKAKITWTSSFEFKPWDRTVEAWTEVARRYAGAELDTRVVTMPWHMDGKAPHLPSLTF
ncbi:oxoglutarate iron-dependent oxygenase [Colletotrichum truncatum]|uniref:Oxoglutarate iron-dependent oxygenase n=1 Tax=Colletotrichum truncatum TaxID=5467 RepID=A0ACC3YGI4_COLTU|nr:oxoglutarate iron-dependent oxygenase [Colletotrichum truncatum]KAF6781474.1 oxoglutarate iron-dependent oxygenase [Colletotrichum truncatum]